MKRNALSRIAVVLVCALGALGGCTQTEAHPVVSPATTTSVPDVAQGCPVKTVQEGKASWYGPNLHGGKTASGESFDQHGNTAAHPTLPLGTPIEVTNLENGRKTTLTVNDRGPHKKGRVLDVSKKGAQDLGFVSDGTAPVRIETSVADCSGQNPESTEASNNGE
jgi:rare lipoprotein A